MRNFGLHGAFVQTGGLLLGGAYLRGNHHEKMSFVFLQRKVGGGGGGGGICLVELPGFSADIGP